MESTEIGIFRAFREHLRHISENQWKSNRNEHKQINAQPPIERTRESKGGDIFFQKYTTCYYISNQFAQYNSNNNNNHISLKFYNDQYKR